MVSRCEVDLKKIRQEFKAHHGKSLHQTINVRCNNILSTVTCRYYKKTDIFLLFYKPQELEIYICIFFRNTQRETTRRPFWVSVEETIKINSCRLQEGPREWLEFSTEIHVFDLDIVPAVLETVPFLFKGSLVITADWKWTNTGACYCNIYTHICTFLGRN